MLTLVYRSDENGTRHGPKRCGQRHVGRCDIPDVLVEQERRGIRTRHTEESEFGQVLDAVHRQLQTGALQESVCAV